MKNKKIRVIVSFLILALAIPALSIPKVGAYPWSATVTLSGLVVRTNFDLFYGLSVTPAREGATVNFIVPITADGTAGQRNVTVGVKLDWMTSFVNATNANPTSTLAIQPNQIVAVTVGVPMPAVSGSNAYINLVPHSWEVRIWNGPQNKPFTVTGCPFATCQSIPASNFAVYSNTQADGILANTQAGVLISSMQLTLSGLTQLPPGAAKASAELAQATSERTLGDNSYAQADFAGAKTHYTNALNLANSAASDLGGVDSADFWRLILTGVGTLLVGVGVLMAAVVGMFYLRRRSKTLAKAA